MRRMKSLTAWCIIFMLCYVLMGSCFINGQNVQAYDVPNGTMFRQYYRLKNVASNLYLTVNSSVDSENTGCSLRPRYAGNDTQIFYLEIDMSTDSYYLIPKSSSSNRVLSLYSSTTGNGNPIVIKTNTSSTTQQWKLYTSTSGCYLRSNHDGRTLTPSSLGVSSGTAISTWTYVSGYSDWIFEPAYSGTASYFVTTSDVQNSTDNNATVNRIVNRLGTMGYTSSRVELPPSGRLRVTLPLNRLTVIHGHGSAGRISLEQTNGSILHVYSENPPSGKEYFEYGTTRNSLVVFITCQGGASTSARCSMAQAAYNKGAGCVIAFNNNVRGGEDYMEIVLDYMKTYPSMPVKDAIANANLHYTAEDRADVSSPAHPGNAVIVGNGNISLNMN